MNTDKKGPSRILICVHRWLICLSEMADKMTYRKEISILSGAVRSPAVSLIQSLILLMALSDQNDGTLIDEVSRLIEQQE